MRKQGFLLFFMTLLLLLPFGLLVKAESSTQNQYIYDHAKLLTDQEVADLQDLARKLGKERNTEFIIMTLNGTDGKDIVQYVEDFYDEQAPGFDGPHGNTAILAIDMQARDVYLAGFRKAETYLDSERLDQIRNKITPDLTDGEYYTAFSTFLHTSHDYMGYEPGVNPENFLFKWWFQIITAIVVAGIIVTIMVYRSGGRVTVNAQTYMDRNRSKILDQSNHFVRETVTRQRKPQSNSQSGGGGGISSGGHSHSGSRGSF